MEIGHELDANDLFGLSDMMNQLARVLQRPSLVIPWFYTKHSFIKTLELPIWLTDLRRCDEYISKIHLVGPCKILPDSGRTTPPRGQQIIDKMNRGMSAIFLNGCSSY